MMTAFCLKRYPVLERRLHCSFGTTLVVNDIFATVRHLSGTEAHIMARLLGFGVKRAMMVRAGKGKHTTRRWVNLTRMKEVFRKRNNDFVNAVTTPTSVRGTGPEMLCPSHAICGLRITSRRSGLRLSAEAWACIRRTDALLTPRAVGFGSPEVT